MRIEPATLPNFTQNYLPASMPPPRYSDPASQIQNKSGIVLDISPEGWARSKALPAGESQKTNLQTSPAECTTCANRKYVDVSDDPSVSFQSPTHISPGQSAASVSSHEREHVTNERARAEQNGREIVSQTVTLKTSICPECKRVYVAGGETRTISRQKNEPELQSPDFQQQ